MARELDLFVAFDRMFRHEPIKSEDETPPSPFIMHRFLASDRDYAQVARTVQRFLREPDMCFEFWRGVVPRGTGAPRLKYTGAKRREDAEPLVLRIMEVEGYNRREAEQAVEFLVATRNTRAACAYYGVEVPK